jgi:predicted dehydrogenase
MSETKTNISRRSFLRSAAAAATAGAVFPQIVPRHVVGGAGHTAPSDTVYVAGIGIGMMGGADVRSAHAAGAKIVSLCDVDKVRAKPVFDEFPNAKRYEDYRELLENEKGVDAVIIGTPDHTHAVITMHAMQAGKHVYTEKPLTHTLYEARVLREKAKEYGVATQLGNQGRTYKSITAMSDCIWSGAIGEVREVHCVQAAFGYSRIDDIPKLRETHKIPKTLNWDLWLGPAQERKYNPMYVPSDWRRWREFGSGNMGDFVCHIVDPVFLALDLGAPESVVAEAEGYDPVKHVETFPKSSKVTFKFPARGDLPPVTLYWYDGDDYEPEGVEQIPDPGWSRDGKRVGGLVVGAKDTIAYGTHGARGWKITNEESMKNYMGDRPMDWEQNVPGTPPNIKHLADWLKACKGWKEADSNFEYGGRLTEIATLGDIALRMLGTELQWDSEHMMFTNNMEANQYLHTQYRDGWSLG